MLMAKTSYKVQAVALLKVMLGIALFMTRFKTHFSRISQLPCMPRIYHERLQTRWRT